ncbi:hypothetical protein D3C84_515480 [compost metagenome]
MGDEFGCTLFQRRQGFELTIDLILLFAQRRSLGRHGGCHQPTFVGRHRTQHIELGLQLRLFGQQRCRQAIQFLNQRLHHILRAFKLGVVGGLGNLLLEIVELVLQCQQFAVGKADGGRGQTVGRCVEQGRRQQHWAAQPENHEHDEHQRFQRIAHRLARWVWATKPMRLGHDTHGRGFFG